MSSFKIEGMATPNITRKSDFNIFNRHNARKSNRALDVKGSTLHIKSSCLILF